MNYEVDEKYIARLLKRSDFSLEETQTRFARLVKSALTTKPLTLKVLECRLTK